MEERQSLQTYFKTLLETVVGQAYRAAGYQLEQAPVKWLGGQYRYSKALNDGMIATIEYQVLVYNDTQWAQRNPSRFQVTLIRSDQPGAVPSNHPRYLRRNLSTLVVDDFGVSILPSADHWWTFKNTETLGAALAEAGHLVVGYGIPWLAGDLQPGDPDTA